MKIKEILKITLTILLLLCLLDWNYGFYEFVRFIGMVGFGILAYQEKDNKNRNWFFIWLISALLINPFLKVSLGREIWNIVDVIWAGLLIYSLFQKHKKVDILEEPTPIIRDPIMKINSKIKENLLINEESPNQEDFTLFHFHRLYYEPPEKIVEIYNNEVEIGLTGEKLQILYLIVFHVIFLEHFEKSPIIIVDNHTIDLKGKIYLTKNSFEYEDKSNLRVIRK